MISFVSERLRFRELMPGDVSDYYIEWLNDPSINRYLETRFFCQDGESVRAFVAAQSSNPDVYLLRMSLAECDTHIGNIKLGPINRYHKSAQISLLIGDRSLHGKGYATEAIGRVSHWGFQEHDLCRIEGGCYEDNIGSLRAFLKSGYVVEGFRRQAVVSVEGTRLGAFWFARLASDNEANK